MSQSIIEEEPAAKYKHPLLHEIYEGLKSLFEFMTDPHDVQEVEEIADMTPHMHWLGSVVAELNSVCCKLQGLHDDVMIADIKKKSTHF